MSQPIAQRGLAALYRRLMAFDQGRRAVRWAFRYPRLTGSIVAVARALGVDAASPGRLLDSLRPPLQPELFAELIAQAPRNEGADQGRVILACGTLAPGGAERQVTNTAIALAGRSGLKISVACDWLTPGRPERFDFHRAELERHGIEVREFPRPIESDLAAVGFPGQALANLRQTFDPLLLDDILGCYLLLRQTRPSVVHAFLDWSNVRAGVAAAMAGVPRIVLSGRNLNPSHFLLHADYMQPAYQALLRQPPVTLTNNSDAGARDYAAWLDIDAASISVIRNGLALPDAPPDRGAAKRFLCELLDIPPEAPLVGGMFRLSIEKDPMLWVDSAATLARERPNTRFVLFGVGPLADDVHARIRAHGITDRILLPGLTERSADAIAGMDVLMMTSWAEGTPNVILEAQWLGTPVVATAGGGTSEAMQHGVTGLVIEDAECVTIADAVGRVLNGEALSDVRSAGRTFVSARYGLQRMADDTLAVYGIHPTSSNS